MTSLLGRVGFHSSAKSLLVVCSKAGVYTERASRHVFVDVPGVLWPGAYLIASLPRLSGGTANTALMCF